MRTGVCVGAPSQISDPEPVFTHTDDSDDDSEKKRRYHTQGRALALNLDWALCW